MRKYLTLLLALVGLWVFGARPVSAQVTATFTYTPTSTNTNTVTFSTPTYTLTGSFTPTFTNTNTRTNTPSPTPCVTNTSTVVSPIPTATRTPTNTPTPLTPTQTATNSPTNTPTNTLFSTATNTATNSPTNTPTAGGTPAVSCNPETIINLSANLSSTQQANQPGGVLQLGPSANPVLPFLAMGNSTLDGSKAEEVPYGTGFAVSQMGNLTQPVNLAPQSYPNHTGALEVEGFSIPAARAAGVTSYAWNQGSALPPALTLTRGVTDSLGAVRQITFYFYQCNDLGAANPVINAGYPNPQVAYAWFAFETTGAQAPSNSNLIGGTGIFDGDNASAADASFDRCIAGDMHWGDFLYFNTDGSLASEGGVWVRGGIAAQGKSYLYLPIAGLSGQFVVAVNFGTAGMLGYGLRDGMTGDPSSFTPSITTTTTITFTPTNTPTNSPTPSPSVTACSTNTVWGETSPGPGSVALTGTLFQQYTLSQPAQITVLMTQLQSVAAGTTYTMGIYNDAVTYPGNLIYQAPPQAAYSGTDALYIGADNVHLNPGNYWLALDIQTGSAYVTGGGGVTPAMTLLNGMDMPNPFPADLNPTVSNSVKLYLSGYMNTCAGFVATTTPLPTSTPSPTFTPTPTGTPVTVTYVYVNNINTCAGAFGCSVTFATACRQLNLDFATTYILMRLGATCGCQPSDIMALRLTMGWDQIVAYYGLDWATFVADLQTRINTLQPEFDTPNMILRGAANDPTQFPINNPASMPDTLVYGSPVSEVCPPCP